MYAGIQAYMEFGKCKNSWIPVCRKRLNGCTNVTKERTKGGRNEKVYKLKRYSRPFQ